MTSSLAPKSFPSLRNVYIPLIVIAVLLVPFIMYDIYYVQGRETYQRDRSFRLLAAIGSQIDGLINREADKLRAAGSPFDSADERDNDLRKRWANEVFGESSFDGSWDPRFAPLLHKYDRNGFVSLQILPLASSFSMEIAYRQKPGDTLISETSRMDTALRLRIDELTRDFFDDVLVADDSGRVWFQFKTPNIQVQNVNVLLWGDNRDKALPISNPAARLQGSQSSPSLQTITGSSLTPFSLVTLASTEKSVRLAGVDYKLFVQPSRVAVKYTQNERPGDGKLNLLVCGLWRADRWRSQSLELPYANIISLILIVLPVFFLSWPFVKVTYMSPKERLRPRDGWYMMLSAVFATLLGTIIVANFYYQNFKRSTTQQALCALATDIQRHFDSEFRLLLSDFDDIQHHEEFVHRLANQETWNPVRLSIDCLSEADGFHHFDQAFYADATGMQRVKLLVKGQITPQTDVSRYAWFRALQFEPTLSESGQEHGKSVSYKKAEENKPHVFTSDRTIARDYQIGLQRSPNTGEFQMLIAKTFPADRVLPKNKRAVLVLVTRPTTLVNPILPPGYGFAVFDQNGLVQLHSDSVRNLEENFFEESRRDPYLMAGALEGKNEFQSINYMGEEKSAYMTPLTGLSTTPLTLMVFRSSALDDIAHLFVVLFWAQLVGIVVLLFVSIAMFDLLRGRRCPPTFLWPKPQHTSSYIYMFLTNSMSAGIFVEFLLAAPDRMTDSLLVEASAIAGGTLVVSVLWFRTNDVEVTENSRFLRNLGFEAPRRIVVVAAAGFLIASPMLLHMRSTHPLGWPHLVPVVFAVLTLIALYHVPKVSTRFFHEAYTAAAVSVLLAIAVVPSIALFRVAWETVNDLELRYSQIAIHTALLDQRQKIGDDYREAEPTLLGKFIDRRWGTGWYMKPLFDLKQIDSKALTPMSGHLTDFSPLEQFLIRGASMYIPARRLGAQFLEADLERSDPENWVEVDGEPRLPVGSKALVAMQPSFWPPPLWILLAGSSAFIILFGWIYHIVRKLFLTDSHPAPALTKVTWSSVEDIKSPYIVIGHPRSRKTTKLRAIRDLASIDFRTALHDGAAFHPWSARTKVVAIDHFEFNIDDPDYNLRRLELVEQLLYQHRYTLVISSTLDPLYYLQEGGAAILAKNQDLLAASIETGKLLDRWSRALSKFQKAELFDQSTMDFRRVVATAAGDNLDIARFTEDTLSKRYLFTPAKIMAIAHGEENRSKLRDLERLLAAWSVVDEIESRTKGYCTNFADAKWVALAGFEAALDRTSHEEVLRILEELANDSRIKCVLFTAIDLWAKVTNESNLQQLSLEHRERWIDVLSKFKLLDVATLDQREFAGRIRRECQPTAYLRQLGAAVFDEFIAKGDPDVRRGAVAFPDEGQVVQVLLDRADSYYRVLWSCFTENERLVLYQLSRDGWANPLNRSAIQQLQRKEFVSTQVPYKVMNESFRRFVLMIASDFEVQLWQKQEDESSWRSVRLGLITMFVALSAWLLYAQKDLFQASIGYIVTIGGAVTAVLNVLGGAKSKSPGIKNQG
jgi:hypothetical protein